jgi:hypothetical protein
MNTSGSYSVGDIIGSLSASSMNRTLSEALIRLAPDKVAVGRFSGCGPRAVAEYSRITGPP